MEELRHQIGNELTAYLKYYIAQPNANKDLIIKYVNSAIELTDEQLFELMISDLEFTNDPPKEIDCKYGCDHCCRINVDMHDYEATVLKNYLKNNFNQQQLSKIKHKAIQKNNITEKLNHEEKNQHRIVCPLLNQEKGICSVYEARPMRCRSFNSKSVSDCIAAFREMKLKYSKNIWHKPLQIASDIEVGITIGLQYKNRTIVKPKSLENHLVNILE
jgi:Fe-S-cluster containining protein